MVHELKSWIRFFEKVITGEKTFEVRINDRNFQIGDELNLREYNEKTNQYTGRNAFFRVPYILGADMHCAVSPVAINKPYVIMSIVPLYFATGYAKEELKAIHHLRS